MRSGRVVLMGWLMLAAGACGRPLGTGIERTGTGGAPPGPDASPRLADAAADAETRADAGARADADAGALGQDGGAPDARDGGGDIPAKLGTKVYGQVAPITREVLRKNVCDPTKRPIIHVS